MSFFARRWLFGDAGCVFYAFCMTLLGVTCISLFTGTSLRKRSTYVTLRVGRSPIVTLTWIELNWSEKLKICCYYWEKDNYQRFLSRIASVNLLFFILLGVETTHTCQLWRWRCFVFKYCHLSSKDNAQYRVPLSSFVKKHLPFRHWKLLDIFTCVQAWKGKIQRIIIIQICYCVLSCHLLSLI